MIITTTNNIENYSIKRYLDVVNANIVIGANFFSDLAASSGQKADKSGSRQSNLSANMKVHVKMRQADVPGGLSALLNKAVNNMVSDVSYTPDDAPDKPSEVSIGNVQGENDSTQEIES